MRTGDCQPTHRNVDTELDELPLLQVVLQRDGEAAESQHPLADEHEEARAEWTKHTRRGVGSGNQQVDGAMVQTLEYALGSRNLCNHRQGMSQPHSILNLNTQYSTLDTL
jgi:hypothetical protein